MKQAIQNMLRRFGYQIEKVRPSVPGPHLHLFQAFLELLNEKRGGKVSFVEIGAHDGNVDDPLHTWIVKYHWRGVLVEPQPALFLQLQANYADCVNLKFCQAVISNSPGKARLFALREMADDPDPTWSSQLASLRKDVISKHRSAIKDFDNRLESYEVPALTYVQMLEENDLLNPDVLQIDTEGFDFEILKLVDFDRHKPLLINYEHCNLTVSDQYACRQYLAKYGYGFASYVRDTVACLPELLAARGFGHSST